MEINADLHGTKLSVINNFAESFIKNKLKILVSFKTEEYRHEFLLNREEAYKLANQLREAIAESERIDFEIDD